MKCISALATFVLLAAAASATEPVRTSNPPQFYDPVPRQIEGWTVKVDPALLKPENQELANRCFAALQNHLQRVRYIVPEDRVTQLQRLPIWIDLQHELTSMQYHPGAGWLKNNGYDPRLEKHVHIPRAAALVDPKMWAKHPYVVLHELAHAYHDQVLSFEHPEVKATWEAARDAGILKDVLLYTGRRVEHYGLTNHKEYFAESTEAYFGVNDFYPFVRAELKEHDPRMFAMQEKIWGPIR
ncbi:MAG: metallopeptidase [Fuerstiella sp.]